MPALPSRPSSNCRSAVVGVEDGVGQASRGGAVADGDERGNLAVELAQERVVGAQPRPHDEQLGLDLRRLAGDRVGERDRRSAAPT